MSENKRAADLKRRGFLLASSVGTAGAVAVVVAPQLKSAPTVAAVAPGKDQRYIGGERAAQYYDTTRV
jgi:cysteine synthase